MVNSKAIDCRGASADKKPMKKTKPAEMTAGKLIGIKVRGGMRYVFYQRTSA